MFSVVVLLSGCIEKPKWLNFTITSNSSEKEYSCEDITYSKKTGKPFANIQLNALPSNFGEFPAIEISNEQNTHMAKFPVERKANGASFVVPAHPDGKAEGGKVTIKLIDETGKGCDAIAFTIEPLPKKPGAFKEMVELIEGSSKEQQRIIGTTRERADGMNVEPTKFDLPFDLAGDLRNGENNPNSLDKVIDGSAEISKDFTSNEWDLLDGLVEESGVLPELSNYVDDISQFEPIPQSDRNKLMECYVEGYGLSAEALSILMWLQIDNEIGDQVAKDTKYLDHSSTLFSVSSILLLKASGGIPNTASNAAAALASSISAWQLQMEALKGLLPSNLDEIEFDYDKAVYLEDDSDLDGTWGNVQVTSSSDGWDASTAVYEKLLSKATAGVTKKWVNVHQTDQATKATSELLEGMFSKEIVNIANDPNSKEPGLITIPPCNFGPTDISDKEYSEAYFANKLQAPAEITDHGKFRVRDTGDATLVVQAIKERFALKSIFTSEPVTIKPIKVNVTPDSYHGDPGDMAVFHVTVENANDPSLEFSIYPEGGHKMHVQQDSKNSYTVTIETSTSEDDFPALLTAKSTSTTGLRGLPDAPARIGSAKLLTGSGITVNPSTTCLKPGESETFTVDAHDLNYKEFTWSASAGSISKDGVFTAPDLPSGSKVSITATSTANSKVTGSAEVFIGDCACFGSASFGVGGSITGMVTEPYIIEPFNTTINVGGIGSDAKLKSVVFNFGDSDGGIFGDLVRKGQKGEKIDSSSIDMGSLLGSLFDKALKGNDGVVLVFKENGPRLGETGRYPALIAGSFGTFGHEFGHDIDMEHTMGILLKPFASMGRENMQPEISVVITNFSEGPEHGTAFLEGYISAYVHYLQISGEYADEVGTFDMSFKGHYDTDAAFGIACSGVGW